MLVVEDDAGLRLALEHGLAAEGFAVETVGDADSACARLSDSRHAVVLLDWGLPDGDGGTAACRRLRSLHPEGHIVMLTGRSDPRDEQAALAAGARAFLTKGIDLGDLAARLRQLLSTG